MFDLNKLNGGVVRGEKPEPDGYICKITNVEIIADKQYLKVEYDIDKGKCKDHFLGLAYFRVNYKPYALKKMNLFIQAIESSNEGYKFTGDEQTLIGKQIGLVLRSKIKNGKEDGLIVAHYASVNTIIAGDFPIYATDIKPKEAVARGKMFDKLEDTDVFCSMMYASEIIRKLHLKYNEITMQYVTNLVFDEKIGYTEVGKRRYVNTKDIIDYYNKYDNEWRKSK